MAKTTEIGSRVELVSMDPHCGDITIGLYRQDAAEYLIHTYSSREDASARIEFVARAMAVLGGMELTGDLVRHSCGELHPLATRRAFLEACKLPSSTALEPKPPRFFDKKRTGFVRRQPGEQPAPSAPQEEGKNIVVDPLGHGAYRVIAEGDAARADAIAAGYRKLAEVVLVDGAIGEFRFPCGVDHNALVGLLLARALNVRLVLREEEMAASRGLLVAPSAQK